MLKHTRILFGIFLLFTIKCASDADIDRKTKIQACLNLLKAALHHDDDYFSTVTSTIDANDVNDLEKKFLTKTIFNCYYTVSLIKSAELIHKKFSNISPFAKDNKEILTIKDLDQQKITRDSGKVENILKELESEYNEYEKMVRTAAQQFAGVFEQKQQKRNKERIQEEEINYDHEYGNTNLSFIRKMDPKIKYSLALGFLALFFLGTYYGLMSLMRKSDNKKTRIKKK